MWFYQCPACFDLPRRHFSLSGPIPQFSICFSMIFHVSSKSSIFPSRSVLQSCTDCAQNIVPVVAPVTAFLFHTQGSCLCFLVGWYPHQLDVQPLPGDLQNHGRDLRIWDGDCSRSLSPLSHPHPTGLSALTFSFCICLISVPAVPLCLHFSLQHNP